MTALRSASHHATTSNSSPLDLARAPVAPAWLAGETGRLLDFARGHGSRAASAGSMPTACRIPAQPLQLLITTRMTHVFALGHLLGVPGCGPLADHGLASLRDTFEDREHGGWFAEVGAAGRTDDQGGLPARLRAAGRLQRGDRGPPRRPARCSIGRRASIERFWSDDEGACVESWDREWRSRRGLSGRQRQHARGRGVPGRARRDRRRAAGPSAPCASPSGSIRDVAGAHDWRVVEHFDAGWTPLPEYNRDEVRHHVPALRGDARPRPRVGAPAPAPACGARRSARLAHPGFAVAVRPRGRRRLAARASCTRPTSTGGRW